MRRRRSSDVATPPRAFFERPVAEVARALLGAELRVGATAGEIVEVEFYDGADPASHSYRGQTPRNGAMFGPGGRLYVYRSYGVHWCCNIVCEAEGSGAAVLIRALRPVRGLAAMRRRRGRDDERQLCAGPGRLCQALGIDGTLDGVPIGAAGVGLRPAEVPPVVCSGPRIGISVATERPWRLGVADSRYLSRPFPRKASM